MNSILSIQYLQLHLLSPINEPLTNFIIVREIMGKSRAFILCRSSEHLVQHLTEVYPIPVIKYLAPYVASLSKTNHGSPHPQQYSKGKPLWGYRRWLVLQPLTTSGLSAFMPPQTVSLNHQAPRVTIQEPPIRPQSTTPIERIPMPEPEVLQPAHSRIAPSETSVAPSEDNPIYSPYVHLYGGVGRTPWWELPLLALGRQWIFRLGDNRGGNRGVCRPKVKEQKGRAMPRLRNRVSHLSPLKYWLPWCNHMFNQPRSTTIEVKAI